MKFIIIVAFVFMLVAGTVYCAFLSSCTRTAPGFDEAAFQRLPTGMDTSAVLRSLGNPFSAWLYDSADFRNEPINPFPGEDVLRSSQVLQVGDLEKLTLFYSRSRVSFLSYRKFVIVFKNGKLTETFVVIED